MVRNAIPAKMEPTMYEDYNQRFCGDTVNTLKRSMTLDLNSNSGPAMKKMKIIPVSTAPVLSSPDYKKLNLNTPEIEKMILTQTGLQTPTPSQLVFPIPKVTQEQELFSRGFENALQELQHSDSSQGAIHHVELPRSSSSSSSSTTYMTLDNQQFQPNHIHDHFALGLSPADSISIKEEPQTVPLGPTPPMSPIDMECQERFKLERKRERNRLAASKCRRRKLERISRLEEKVKVLKGENSELSSVVSKLKEQVCILKERVLEHVQSGCHILHLNSC